MAKLEIDIGVEGNDGTGDSIRESFRKVNANFNELYAVFGIGGQISFTDLGDVPNTYEGNENKIPVVRANATGLSFLELASDNALSGQQDTIGFDFSQEGKLVIRQLSSKLSLDPAPSLSGPLNAAAQPIARVNVSQSAVNTFNSIYGTNITIGDLVIDKKYADRNYQEKASAGSGIRVGDEPENIDQYSRSTTQLILGNLEIPNHGLSEVFNGAPFVFESSGDDPFGVVSGNIYFLRIVDENRISLYETEQDAIDATNRILLSGGSGTFTITDAAYDPTLQGNWLSNVALPRKSVVRRQGDNMEGPLNLHDHPGVLQGFDNSTSLDNLQAVSKLYADSFDTTSQINLFVRSTGSDDQSNTPFGYEGRNPAYAFKTINAACRKAEELVISSPIEPGPYMQTITFDNGIFKSVVDQKGFSTPAGFPVNRSNVRVLISKNKKFVARETIEYLKSEYDDFDFNETLYQEIIKNILDSVSLDALSGNNANYLSRYAGLKFYSTFKLRQLIGKNRTQTLAAIEYAQLLVVDLILSNKEVGVDLGTTLYQTRIQQFIDETVEVDGLAESVIDDKFNTIKSVIIDGVLDAPRVIDGQATYKLEISNGSFGFVDQGNPLNTDIISGKVIRGQTSGAIGRIISYTRGIDPLVTNSSIDELEIQLLEPKEFQNDETLEYGNFVQSVQVTVNVESGIYEEDYPIRVPANTSINGDEFRRVIIRPKKRVSQSRYADLFFYRDAEFDGLVLGKSNITEVSVLNTYDQNRNQGTYVVDDNDYETDKFGNSAVFSIEISDGEVTDVQIVSGGQDFQKNELITVNGQLFGSNASDLLIRVEKIPNGIEYINPLTQEVDAYFGYHYLQNPDRLRNTGSGYTNIGNWGITSATLIDNKDFISEQVINFIEFQESISISSEDKAILETEIKSTVDFIAKDLTLGSNEFSLEKQGTIKDNKTQNIIEYLEIGLDHIYTLSEDLLIGQTPSTLYGENLEYPTPDLFNGSSEPDQWESNKQYSKNDVVRFFVAGVFRYYQSKIKHISGNQLDSNEIQTRWNEVPGPLVTVRNLLDTVLFSFNSDYNPPLRNQDLDVFLMNDATILRNITVQGHGGFMCVLDPEGQILTKSPYIQTGSSFSQSKNKQAFRGGMYIDAFVGNSAMQVTERVDGNPFKLRVQSLGSQNEPQGLFVRRPQTPCPFFIDGRRFQVNAVTEYDPDFGTATLILDQTSNDGDGFVGLTSTLPTGVDLSDLSSPIPVTLQTAGNRSMLGNDFTQINDLGYGLVVNNGALSEMVSMFTYYCWAGYYSNNGSQIRSLTGSTCYGEYGLVAEGSDPNEIPDDIFLVEDMVQSGKSFSSQIILYLEGPVNLSQGETVLQNNTLARGTVVVDTNSNSLYLTDISGTFNLTQELESIVEKNILSITNSEPATVVVSDITQLNNGDDVFISGLVGMNQLNDDSYFIGNIDTNNLTLQLFSDQSLTQPVDSTGFNPYIFGGTLRKTTSLGSNSVPYDVDTTGYLNNRENLFIHVYDFKDPPSNRSEFDVYHQERNTIARYEVANVQRTDAWLGRYRDVNTKIPTITASTGTGAIFTIYKTVNDGYSVEITSQGNNYSIGDTFDVPGIFLGGDSSNDATITVTDTNNGEISQVSIVGDIFVDDTTPFYSGKVYRMNFSTADADIGSSGLLESVDFGEDINYRRNQNHILGDVQSPEFLTIRPSTAIVFDENPREVYRSVSFITSNSLGDELASDQVQASFDTGYDFIRLFVDTVRASENTFAGSGTAMGSKPGDRVIALQPNADDNEIFRLNNNSRTPIQNRPVGWSVDSLAHEAPIFVWGGKKHFVYNYRGVNFENGSFVEAAPSDNNVYAIVDIDDVGEDINIPSSPTGIAKSVVIPGAATTLRAGLRKDATGDVTINISTCRATAHDFLDVGTGSFNQSNYPNVIFGPPREKNQANEVDERGKGRVFYVSTDQDGVFRVGKFFNVDQGTGTVTFSASIALSDVDGLGFKRGVVVNEFSTDTSMAENSSDTVPTESAVRGYVNRRLGFDHQGNIIVNLIGPGVLAKDGSIPLSGNLNAASNTIANLRGPISNDDAATKLYVDQSVASTDSLFKLEDINFSPTISNGELIVFNGDQNKWNNVSFSTDSEVSDATVLLNNNEAKIKINPNSIKNANVNSNAAIAQSKLNLNSASTRSDAVGISQADLGVSTFNNSVFSSDNGWIDLTDAVSETTGVKLEKIQHISSNTVLGRTASSVGAVSEITFGMIVDIGDGLQNSDFSIVIPASEQPGQVLVKRTTGQSTPYGLSDISTFGLANSIVKTKSNGSIQVNSLILGGNESYEILSLSGEANTTLNIKTPGQGTVLTATGTSNPTVRIPGNLRIGDTNVDQSVLQSTSNFNQNSRLGVNWIYSKFIEAADEKGSGSTGLAIGAGTGLTTSGQIAVVTRNASNNTSVVPALFSSTGFRPDVDDEYDIGTSNQKYKTVYANLFNGTALEAFYADLAENYLGDYNYEPGTVLIFGGDEEVTTTNKKGDHRIAGVVSTNPATLMNSALEGEFVVALALQGRVPCKVIGRVAKGDMLVSSAIPGYAIVNNNPSVGTVIGKSLENKNDDSKGIVEVVVGKH